MAELKGQTNKPLKRLWIVCGKRCLSAPVISNLLTPARFPVLPELALVFVLERPTRDSARANGSLPLPIASPQPNISAIGVP